MALSSAEIEQIRAAARKITERMKTDPSYKEKIEADPVGTLTAAGLQKEAVLDFMRETDLGDVAGYAAQTVSIPCIVGSCLLSCLAASE